MKMRQGIKPEDIVGLVGVGLILAGILLLAFAGVAARNVSRPVPRLPARSITLGPGHAD